MKMVSQKTGTGNWIFILLPFLYALTFSLWLFFAPAFSITARSDDAGQGLAASIAMGSYLALFLVHTVLFLILKAQRVNLLFALACLTLFFRTGAKQGESVFSQIFAPGDWSSWLVMARIEYLAFPVMGILAVGIMRALFPGVLQKWFIYAMGVLMALFSMFFLFASDSELAWVQWGFAGLFGAATLFFLIRMVVMLRHIDLEQIVFLIGAAVFLYSAASDITRAMNASSGILAVLFPFAPVGSFASHALLLLAFIASSVFMIATARGIREAEAARYLLAAREMIADSRLDSQREQFGRLMESIESARFLRHDLRHHLAVVSEYAHSGNIAAIRGYMEGVENGLAAARGKVYCENYAVSAITAYHISLADKQGVATTVNLAVPKDTGRVWEGDLCVIVGNLLENAVEACRNVDEGGRFIRIFAYVQDDTLTISMENSFDGRAKEHGGVFYSKKRDGEGVGLSSVKAVAAKYGGAARFETKGRMFLSSVYLLLGEE